MSALRAALVLIVTICSVSRLFAQAEVEPREAPDASVLNEEQWKQLDASVDSGLAWLATKQRADGSFESIDLGQPAVTSFCLMAFLAQGESPSDGKYQERLTKAIDFIADQQKPNGLIALSAPAAAPIPRGLIDDQFEGQSARSKVGIAVVYNHAISALALSEAYGQCGPEQSEKLANVIEEAIAATLEMQRWDTKEKKDVGGWRYLDRRIDGPDGERFHKPDSDLSVTGWQLMFLRSARNAGFDVPEKSISEAVKYVENCFLEGDNRQVHAYLVDKELTCTRAMAGAGVLALAHAGKHESKEAIASGGWLLKRDFKNYNADEPIYDYPWLPDRYHYGAVLCTQAMYQLGGKYWEQFYPPLVETLLANQRADGSWPPERADKQFGNCYSTALCILSLSVPNQMLPIFQR